MRKLLIGSDWYTGFRVVWTGKSRKELHRQIRYYLAQGYRVREV